MLFNVLAMVVFGVGGSTVYRCARRRPRLAWGAINQPSGVPTGAIMFAHDVGIRHYAQTENTITHWVDVEDHGGHFAVLEEPELLTTDIRTFFRALR